MTAVPTADRALRGSASAGAPGRRVRRAAWWAVAAAFVIAATLAVAVYSAAQQPRRAYLDPENPSPGGAQAIAAVVAERGTAVDIVRDRAQLEAAGVDRTTAVLVADPSDLTDGTARALAATSADAAELIVLAAPARLLDVLAPAIDAVRSEQSDVAARCSNDLADPADVVAAFHTAYVLEGDAPTDGSDSRLEACYTGPDGAALARLEGARPPLTVVGGSQFLTNGSILSADHAALAVRLLGRHPRLVWYVPDAADAAAGDAPARDAIVPAVAEPALLVLASAVLALVLWRGRRLGRLVTEPLPVVVRAAETTESRGRMYRKAKDRSRAIAVLQQATRLRLATYLGIPRGADVSATAAAVSAATGRSYDEVLALLRDPHVGDDSELVRVAGRLAELESALRGRPPERHTRQ